MVLVLTLERVQTDFDHTNLVTVVVNCTLKVVTLKRYLIATFVTLFIHWWIQPY